MCRVRHIGWASFEIWSIACMLNASCVYAISQDRTIIIIFLSMLSILLIVRWSNMNMDAWSLEIAFNILNIHVVIVELWASYISTKKITFLMHRISQLYKNVRKRNGMIGTVKEFLAIWASDVLLLILCITAIHDNYCTL